MCEQDLEAGVAIVDIGGGTTDLAVFYEGILRHTAVIPFGGENITIDIKNGLSVLRTQAEQMKVQFGSALSNEARANTFITIPGLRGMQPKEIAVKNLASIIQARMSEIMEFVAFHLKQAGLDNRLLNGGIILTGGGSQLKHLLQLTEYVTGLNARIGFPNEHLASGHIEELAKPMYSTCIGLILKGYNDYENKNRKFADTFVKIEVPESLQVPSAGEALTQPEPEVETLVRIEQPQQPGSRKSLKEFMDSFKNGLIDLFREEGDTRLG
jgi:cell division protein FtsA